MQASNVCSKHLTHKENTDMKYIIFDTETTGKTTTRGEPSPTNIDHFPHVVSISWVIANIDKNGEDSIVDSKHIIVTLPDNVDNDPTALEIHGITKQMTIDQGIPPLDALKQFTEAIKDTDWLIAHNMSFDRRAVQAMWLRLLMESSQENEVTESYSRFTKEHRRIVKSKSIYCTMMSTTEFCKLPQTWKSEHQYPRRTPVKDQYKWPKLEELHEKLFDIKPANLHNSLHDCLVCLRCYMKFVHNNDILDSLSIRQTFTDKGILV